MVRVCVRLRLGVGVEQAIKEYLELDLSFKSLPL
jgi:hypothetical protein